MRRILALLTAAALAAALAGPVGASTLAFHASGPGANATWITESGGLTTETRLLVFRQNQGVGILVAQSVYEGDTLVSDASGWARTRVWVEPHLGSVSIAATTVSVVPCNADYTLCGEPFDVDVPAITWTGVGDITPGPAANWSGPVAPPPFCLEHTAVDFRDATVSPGGDPFGGDLGAIGPLSDAYLFDVRVFWVSVKGGCFPG